MQLSSKESNEMEVGRVLILSEVVRTGQGVVRVVTENKEKLC